MPFSGMFEQATGVLRRNDAGGWTRAGAGLYPHQWSWDAAFIAIGLARLDPVRAVRELTTLFDHQWNSGKVPHIVFDPEAPPGSYFPGAEHWTSAARSPGDPDPPPYTSCLCQPPVHAIAARCIWKAAGRDGTDVSNSLLNLYPKLLRWHRYLATTRDPEGSGLVTIYHPWESGTDNSPRWDAALENVVIGEMPDYERRDLQHVDDPTERPTGREYDRYIWLVELIKRAGCDDAEIYASHPFLVKDVLFSAILVAADEALWELADAIGAPKREREEILARAERGRAGLETRWDPSLGLCLDYDLNRDAPLAARTVAGFAPLFAGGLGPDRLRGLLVTLDSDVFLGHPALHLSLPPSASPEETGFRPRSYWRGPTWPVINWLLWWSLKRAGEAGRAEKLRRTALGQLAEGGFAEYFEPFTGEALGSPEQSWTAAVALDWLSAGA